jgi:hypothetical protein
MVKRKVIKIEPIDTASTSPEKGEVDDRTREFPLFSSSLLRGKGARGGRGLDLRATPLAGYEREREKKRG